MKPDLITLLQRVQGWRLCVLVSIGAVAGAELISTAMSLLIHGEIKSDYLLTGLVASGIIAPPSLALLSYLLGAISRRQEALLVNDARHADSRLKVALEATHLICWELDFVNDDLRYDDALLSLLDMDAADPPHSLHAWLDRVHPDHRAEFESRVLASLQAGDPTFDFEYRVAQTAGRWGWLQTHGRVIRRDAAGRAELAVGTTKNITERKQGEEALRHSESLLSTILQATDEGILVVAQDGSVLCANKRFVDLWRVPQALVDAGQDAPLLEYVVDQLIHPADFLTQVNQLYDTQEESHDTLQFKDGRVFARFTGSLSIDGEYGRIWCFKDITEQVHAQTALAESRNLLQTIIDAAPIRVFWKDQHLRYLGCNPAFARDAGKTRPDEVIGKDDTQMAWADQAERYNADDRGVLESGVARIAYDEPQTTPDGRTIWLRTSKVPLRNHDNETIGVLGIYEDITEQKELADALRQREEYQRALLDNFPYLVWLKDENSRYLAVNQPFAESCGCASPQRITGKSDRDLWPPDQAVAYVADDRAVLASGQPKNIDEQVEVDGRCVWYETYKSPVTIDGRTIGTVGFARDITERKQNEAELEQHRHHLEELVQQRTAELMATEAKASLILQSSADGLYGVDAEGIITFINPAALAMLGYSAEQVIGRSSHALFHHSRPDGTPYPLDECPSHSALRIGQQIRVDNEVYWHADGHAVPVMYAVHPTHRNGGISGAVISLVDISEQRAAAEARERALVAAEHLARVRSQFLANMSHEIRTPLNGVLGFAQIGIRNFQNSEKARNAFEKIIASGNQLLGVVNDVLDFSKIEAGKMRIDPIEMPLDEVIDHAVAVVGERARAKQLDLRVDRVPGLPRICVGDPLRIGQVLMNLLSNAVKFTETGSVTLTASRQGDWLVFRVDDTGIGMDEEQLGQLFQPFQQADGSTTRKFGGTGLGLAISKRILELMDGDIHVESRLGLGSTVEFRVPYVRPGASPMPDPVAGAAVPEQPLTGISILLAEDDTINGLVLEENLQEDGARVVRVGNGWEAVERVSRDGPEAYDIVLMDIQMPEMDGYQAALRIREIAPDLPIIGQTAHALDEARESCFASGMVAHIAKPIDHEALVKLLRLHVAVRHKE